jgi:hypothetical protein
MDKSFIAGVGFAISYLVNAHGEDTIAGYLYREAGFTLKEYKESCDKYDIPKIKKAIKSVIIK